jgi:hypothetical protein
MRQREEDEKAPTIKTTEKRVASNNTTGKR